MVSIQSSLLVYSEKFLKKLTAPVSKHVPPAAGSAKAYAKLKAIVKKLKTTLKQ
ncbi:MAG: hypothetical protein QXI42_04855 [Thermoproteota archaeon]|nr:hypothetical protein [Candidatus Brockarchaeota archaeon]